MIYNKKRISMFQANVYRIMVASPSDIQEEIKVAFNVLNHWNDLHSEKSRMVLLPLHWSISSYPAAGNHPQKLLDKQVVEKSDLLVCVFGAKLGTPTDTEISGTVEEIKEHRKAGKDVMVFFKLSIDNITSVDLEQLQKIKDFKETIKNDVLWCDFSDANDFEQKLSDKLQLYVNDHWLGNTMNLEHKEDLKEVFFSDDEKEIIKQWVQSTNSTCHWVRTKDGCICFMGDSQRIIQEGKEWAAFVDFIDRLVKVGFIWLEQYNRHGDPVYQLKKAAYDYVDTVSCDKNQLNEK